MEGGTLRVVGGATAGEFFEDLRTLRAQPIDGFDEHVRMYVQEIENPALRVVFVRWYARLCRGYGRLFERNVNPSDVFTAGWNTVRLWSHYPEQLLGLVKDHESFDTIDTRNLVLLSKGCVKVFILHDYLRCFDAEGPGHHVPMLNRMFALLSALNAPDTYSAAREVAMSGLEDGGDT